MKCLNSQWAALGVLLLLAGCEVGPDYVRPPVEVPKEYKETKNYGNWQKSAPQDDASRGDWWAVYKDPILSGLEKQIDVSNQNLKAAEASYREARAIVEESRASLFPIVTANAAGTKSGGGSSAAPKGTQTLYDLSAGASWVPDVWGRIRRIIESNIATAQASAADLASARLSAQAELASDYFDLRTEDELQRLLDATVEADKKILQIVQNEYDQGVVAKADVLSAQTQLESIEAQDINVGVLRAQLEHAIAVLIGKAPAELTLAPGPLADQIPEMPPGLPSTLLQRRPDIASAERQVAAANAQIGVAIASYFPDLTLSASYGFTSSALGNLAQAPSNVWSFGPALAETVIDFGARAAQVEAARAAYDQTVANYRQTVLTGFQQVEDNLAALRILADQAKMEEAVVADAQKTEELTLNQYKEGTVAYNSVLTAQITTLTNEQTALTVRQNRLLASVALIEALGGGWSDAELAGDKLPPAKAGSSNSDSAALSGFEIY